MARRHIVRRAALLVCAAALIALPLALVHTANAQPEFNLDEILNGELSLDPGRPHTVFVLKSLIISAHDEFALVAYTQQTDDGPEVSQLGWIFLSNDRLINYKMGMITLLRDALDDPTRSVAIQIVPETAASNRRVIASVSLGPATD